MIEQIKNLRNVLWLNPYVRMDAHQANMLAQYIVNEGWLKQSEPFSCGHVNGVEWISVEDRLPDGQGHFLTVDDTGYMMVAMWTKQFGWFSHICKANKITHWMPLPQPPEMKGGE